MKLLSVSDKRDGEMFPRAWISVGRFIGRQFANDRPVEDQFRGWFLVFYLPFPFRSAYTEPDKFETVFGLRAPRVAVALWRTLQGKWRPRLNVWMAPL